MRILIDVGHPAHVHFFKNFIWEMRKRGHELVITARDKDVALRLLKAYGIEYTVVGHASKRKFGLMVEWLKRDWKIYSLAKKFHPDILVGIHNPCVAHVAKLIGARSVIFTDTEHAKLANLVTFPFSDVIYTPSCFIKDLGKKQVRYNSFHELAYLHPHYFKPDPSVLGSLKLSRDDKFIVVRFITWCANHDIGQHGFDMGAKQRLLAELGKYGSVFIISEGSLPEEFEKCRPGIPPERAHDLLYYATLYIGEGATMATEAAMLGTPAIYVSSLWDTMGNFIELGEHFRLVYSFKNPEAAIQKAVELLQQPDLKQVWGQKREQFLADKIDVTQFMTESIQSYQR